MLLNFLVVLAISKTTRPVFGLFLWILIPQALAVVGTYQVRQGFAFSIMLFLILKFNKPVIGCLTASLIHTTFIIPLIYALIFNAGRLLKLSIIYLLSLYLVATFLLVVNANELFVNYGGRRTEQYLIDEGASSINFVFGALVHTMPSILYLFQTRKTLTPTTELAAIHVGCTVFLALSFFLFPIGTSRVGYFISLFSIAIIPALRVKTRIELGWLLLILIAIIYFITKAFIYQGGYDEILRGW